MSAPAIVLCYHRVREAPDPLHLSVHPDRFAAQLEAIAAVADVVPASEIGGTSEGLRPRVAITFDDGYADNLEAAAPALLACGLPATFFFTTAAVDGTGDFWWERLDHLVLDVDPARPFLAVELDGRSVRVDVRTPEGRRRAHRLLNDHLLGCAPEAQDRLLASVPATPTARSPSSRCASWWLTMASTSAATPPTTRSSLASTARRRRRRSARTALA